MLCLLASVFTFSSSGPALCFSPMPLCPPRVFLYFPPSRIIFSAPSDLGSQSCTFSISLPSNGLSTYPVVLESPWQQTLPKKEGREDSGSSKRTLCFRTGHSYHSASSKMLTLVVPRGCHSLFQPKPSEVAGSELGKTDFSLGMFK